MPGPIEKNITLWRGTAPILTFSVIDDAAAPVDITGWTATLTIRLTTATPDPPSVAKAAAIIGSPVNGLFRVTLTKAETLTLEVRKYVFSLVRTNAGSEDLLTFGIATVLSDILNPV